MLFDFIKRFWFINPTAGFFIGGGGGAASFQLTNSVRLRASASPYLSRSMSAPTNNLKWTLSKWIKRGDISTHCIFGAGTAPSFVALFNASHNFQIFIAGTSYFVTSQVFRDPSAWMHLVLVYDSANATQADRIILYVNGVRASTTTASCPSSQASGVNANGVASVLGRPLSGYFGDSRDYFDGYFSDVYFVDGQALAPSSFGEQNLDGVWVPKQYAGTYGSNGFHQDFKDAALTSGSNVGLGKDVSGNGNYWNTTGISVTAGTTYDSMVDTPTNNYATLTPLKVLTNAPSQANLAVGTAAYCYGQATICENMKQYVEFKCNGSAAGPNIFVRPVGAPLSAIGDINAYNTVYYRADGAVIQNGSTIATYAAQSTGVVGVELDNTTSPPTVRFFLNGTPQAAAFNLADVGVNDIYVIGALGNGTGYEVNFGQAPLSSGAAWRAAAGGYFNYAPTTGFKALCTANLPAVAISKPVAHFNAKTRVGTAATYSVTGEAFQPDFVWVKSRGRAVGHALYDSVRGVQKRLETNNTDAEVTGDSTGLTAFNSDGYTGGALDQINGTAATNSFVDWMWKAGGAPTTDNVAGAGNTPTAGSVKIDGANLGSALAGTIAATRLSANTTAGFSVITYTGTGANATIAHGLGVAPKMVITRCRNYGSARNWSVWHSGIANTEFLNFNGTDAKATDATMWNSTSPTTAVFSVGSSANSNLNTYTFVAYAFKEIAGYSKFGSVVANGSADGPFVNCGFRPRFVMWKNISGTGGWVMYDTKRDTYNTCNAGVEGNLSSIEQATWGPVDILSNGFKFRSVVVSDTNYSTNTYIFAAFAEHPFGGSNVAPSPAR